MINYRRTATIAVPEQEQSYSYSPIPPWTRMFDRAARSPSSTWNERHWAWPTPTIRDALSRQSDQSAGPAQD